MSRLRLAAAAAVAALVALSQVVAAQQNPYQTIENHFTLPEGRKIGSTAGITIDRDGSSVWVFERCGAQNCLGSHVAPVLKFDAAGKLLKSFGEGKVVSFIPDPDPDGSQEGVAVDAQGNIYGSLTAGMALKKYVRR